jgi:hypothetical protein
MTERRTLNGRARPRARYMRGYRIAAGQTAHLNIPIALLARVLAGADLRQLLIAEYGIEVANAIHVQADALRTGGAT